VFVIYDNAQFARRSPQHRAQIERGETKYITIPVTRASEKTLIKDVNIRLETPWPLEHLYLIKERYGTEARFLEPYFEAIIPPVFDSAVKDTSGLDTPTFNQVSKARELDRQWRSNKSKLDNLKNERNDLGDRISSASAAEKEKLILEAKEIKQEIRELESEVREIKQSRDFILVDIGQTIEENCEGDTPNYLLPSSTIWDKIHPNVINSQAVNLTDFIVPLLEYLFDEFNIESEIVLASELPIDTGDDPSKYLARLTEYFGGTNYLSGKFGANEYLDEDIFNKRDIEVSVQDWTPSWERGNVCCLDVLYNSSEPGQYIR
jgi:hypothetical protein